MNHRDVYSNDIEYIPLKHDAADWGDVFADDESDDLEVQDIASELTGRWPEEY